MNFIGNQKSPHMFAVNEGDLTHTFIMGTTGKGMSFAPVPALQEDCVGNYPALECPMCGVERKPRSLNKDGSVTYSCPPDHVNHGSQYTWRIAVDGTLID